MKAVAFQALAYATYDTQRFLCADVRLFIRQIKRGFMSQPRSEIPCHMRNVILFPSVLLSDGPFSACSFCAEPQLALPLKD